MIMLAGAGHRLIDPCCGSGTILAEALSNGWVATGTDIDPKAIEAAQRNAPAAHVSIGDVLTIQPPSELYDAVVSNLPFGKQFAVSRRWYEQFLAQARGLVKPEARLVVLAPRKEFEVCVENSGQRVLETHDLQILGAPTTLWVLGK